MSIRGFLLQPSYRLLGSRPVVHLWGRLESGETFLLRDRRLTPHFFVPRADGPRAAQLGAHRQVPSQRVTMAGDAVVRVEVERPADTPALRDRLEDQGISSYEADVRFALRYLIDRGIRGSLALAGPSQPGAAVGQRVDRVFDDPEEVSPASWSPRLSVLSFDIETDPQARRLLSVSLFGCGRAEVLLLTPPGWSAPPDTQPLPTEADLLRAFVARVQEVDPDVLTGWNVVGFDLPVLARMADRLGVPFELGRAPGRLRLRQGGAGMGMAHATIPGRLVLDGLQLVRGASVKMEEYSLDAVARQVLGEGKLLTGSHRAEEILRAFEHDREHFAAYNLADSRLALEIIEKLHLVELAVERSLLTGLPPDRVAASVAAFDFLYLSELHRRGIVGPTAQRRLPGRGTSNLGGYVMEPRPGLYDHVLVFDFKSLYPSLIRTFQIDPLGYLPEPTPEDDPIVAPNGAAFARRPGILPGLLAELFPRREAAKKAGDQVTSYAIKILMNSFYGVLGTSSCRFARSELANAITSFGRELLLWCRERIETGHGLQVIYGDTDSLFIASGADGPDEARRRGAELLADLNRDLSEHVRSTWKVDSRLELEFERLYLRLVLPPVRGGTSGARKRYVGLVEEDGQQRVVFTGMESVRRDWTELARRAQRELYQRLFAEEPVEAYLRRTVAALRAGELDDLLIYRKALRKGLEEYTSTTPPHVAAARKMRRPRRLVAYVVTSAGPEPADDRRHPFDYEHYVAKQLRPVAEPVLDLLGLDFARTVGDESQLELF